MLYRYNIPSSRHVQNTFLCKVYTHIKHISSFHIPGRVSYGIRTGWLTNEIFFFFLYSWKKYFHSNYSFLFHQAETEYRISKDKKKNPFVLSIIHWNWMKQKQKFLRIFRFTRFIILLKYFQFITERSSFSYCMGAEQKH